MKSEETLRMRFLQSWRSRPISIRAAVIVGVLTAVGSIVAAILSQNSKVSGQSVSVSENGTVQESVLQTNPQYSPVTVSIEKHYGAFLLQQTSGGQFFIGEQATFRVQAPENVYNNSLWCAVSLDTPNAVTEPLQRCDNILVAAIPRPFVDDDGKQLPPASITDLKLHVDVFSDQSRSKKLASLVHSLSVFNFLGPGALQDVASKSNLSVSELVDVSVAYRGAAMPTEFQCKWEAKFYGKVIPKDAQGCLISVSFSGKDLSCNSWKVSPSGESEVWVKRTVTDLTGREFGIPKHVKFSLHDIPFADLRESVTSDSLHASALKKRSARFPNGNAIFWVDVILERPSFLSCNYRAFMSVDGAPFDDLTVNRDVNFMALDEDRAASETLELIVKFVSSDGRELGPFKERIVGFKGEYRGDGEPKIEIASGGWIGVAIETLNPELAASLGWSELRGARITKVEEFGPADEGGLQVGDIITKIDRHAVVSSSD